MKRLVKLSSISIILLLLASLFVSCSEEHDLGVYVPEDIWQVNNATYYTFSEAMAAVQEQSSSKAIDESNTIMLIRDVGEYERGEGIVIPAEFTGEIEVDLRGNEYWFEDNLDYFLEVRGGSKVNLVNGTTVISEDANKIPKALIVDAKVVTLKDQKIDDRRLYPMAIEIGPNGILNVGSGADINGDISVAGGGELGVSGGNLEVNNLKVESSEEGKTATVEISGGNIGVSKLDAGANSSVEITEASDTVKTSVTIANVSAQGSSDTTKAKITVSGGSVSVTEKLEAKQNSEINIAKKTATATAAASEPVVSIKALEAKGSNDSSKATVKVTGGTVSFDDLTSKEHSSVTITKAEDETSATVVISNTKAEGTTSDIKIESGTVTFETSIEDADSKVSISGGTIITAHDLDDQVDNIIQNTGAQENVTHEYVHVYGAWIVDSEPTCTTKGSRHHDCIYDDCIDHQYNGWREVEDIPALGHALQAVAEVSPTCTETGVSSHWRCTRCGKLFSDSAGTTEVSESDLVIAALGHDLTEVKAVAATCTSTGNITYYRCERCGGLFSDANGENEITAAEVVIGKIDHKYNADEWASDGTYHWHECVYGCGTKTDEDEHEFGEWEGEESGTQTRTCTVCGYMEAKEHEHSLSKVPAVAATCTETGVKEHWKCTICGKLFSDEAGTTEIQSTAEILTPATGHSLSAVAAKAATCTATGNIAYYRCSVCGKLFSDAKGETEITQEATVTPMIPHKYEDWSSDETNHWHECVYGCGTKTDEHEHEFGNWSINEDGLWTRTCSICGYVYETEHVHELETVAAKAATCTEAGNIAYWKCSTCGKYFSDEACTIEITQGDTVIPATGHTYSGYERTSTEHWQVCTVCGAATAHEAHKEGTAKYTADGTHMHVTWSCSVCGEEDCVPTAVTQPSTGAFVLVETYNGVIATKQSEGVWALSLDASVITGLGGDVSKTRWTNQSNNTVISNQSSITVTISDGLSRGVVLVQYYAADGTTLVGGGYVILPGKAVSGN